MAVATYAARRFLQALVVTFGVSVIAFGLLFLGGDPALLMVGEDWTVAQVENFRSRMGFDQPWYVQYVQFAGNALQGDFGDSLRAHQSVSALLLDRLPATLRLAGLSVLISLVVALPLGILAATRRGSLWDHIATGIAVSGMAIPVFVTGMLLLYFVGVRWQLLPISGSGSWQHLVLPSITLASLFTARLTRMVRSTMLEVLSTDYVRTAKAKGLPQRIVVYRHALRNALIPVVTLLGLQLGVLLGGAIITESIFAYPGMGTLVLQAIYNKDFPVVQGVVIFLATSFVFVNFLVDLSYAFLDPRVRY